MHSTDRYMCIKFEVSTTNISGVIDTNIKRTNMTAKKEYIGYCSNNYVHTCST